METKRIIESMQIDAPREKVWEVLTNENFLLQWYSAFGEGMKADTDWEVGSEVLFTDKSDSGLIGKIIKNIPCQLLEIQYEGEIKNGKEDYESEAAEAVKGGKEIYHLTGSGNATTLIISCDMSEEYFDMMSAAWENALWKIKELAEEH